MKGWDMLKKTDRGTGLTKDMRLTIPEGADVRFHILDTEPEHFLWHSDGKEWGVCKGIKCDLCERDIKKSDRYAMNVYDFATRSVKVLEGGKMIFNQLLAMWESMENDFSKVDFKISRTGSRLTTKYTVVPVMPTKFDKETDKRTLYNLGEIYGKGVVELEKPDSAPF